MNTCRNIENPYGRIVRSLKFPTESAESNEMIAFEFNQITVESFSNSAIICGMPEIDARESESIWTQEAHPKQTVTKWLSSDKAFEMLTIAVCSAFFLEIREKL